MEKRRIKFLSGQTILFFVDKSLADKINTSPGIRKKVGLKPRAKAKTGEIVKLKIGKQAAALLNISRFGPKRSIPALISLSCF